MRPIRIHLLLLLLLAFTTGVAHAKTCLVLSGGGARGLAHVGVLKVLERERVPIHCVVGTSMGAVIGSLYASGLDASEIETAMAAIDWSTVLQDEPARTDLPLRMRQQDRSFLVGAAIGYRDGKFGLPRALVRGQRFGIVLRGLLLPAAGIENFDDLPIPFRAVATDLESGIMQVLADGDLAGAARASMAVPGILPPAERNGRLLIDGGAVSNLPVSVARDLGADRIIAVDISMPLRSREQLTSPLAVTDQMVTTMMRRQTEAEIAALAHTDLLLQPDLGPIGSLDFVAAQTGAVAPGERAAEAMRDKLAALALAPDAYAAWRESRRGMIKAIGAPARIELDTTAAPGRAAVLRAYLREHPTEAIDQARLEADIARLYGRGEFDSVDYRIAREQDENVLRVTLRDREWGSGTLRFGLRLEDDFDGSSNFDLGGRLRATEVNDRGAEWIAEGQIGKTTRVAYEWLQPLDAARRWWLLPHTAYTARNQPLFFGEERVLELRRQSLEVGVDAGRWIDDWGVLSLGVFRRTSRYDARTAASDFAPLQQNTAGLRLDYQHDTQDDAQFPRRGQFVQAALRHHLDALGGDFDASVLELRGLQAFGLGEDDRLLFQTRLQYTEGDLLPGDEYSFLGGFLDLSGLPEDARLGRHSALGQAIYYHPLTTVFDRYRVFLGGSLESGGTWETDSEISLDSLIWGGSVFAAAESPLGALYFGYGRTEAGEDSLYLFVGRPY